MVNLFLTTLASDGRLTNGGVARYQEAIIKAYPELRYEELPWRISTMTAIKFFLQNIPKKFSGTVLINHVFPLGTACAYATLLRPWDYLIHLHGLDVDRARNTPLRSRRFSWVLRRAQGVIVNSNALAKEVAGYGISPEKIRVVYPCVSEELVRASEKLHKGILYRSPQELMKFLTHAAVQSSGAGVAIIPPEEPSADVSRGLRLLTVGRLVARKGHKKVLEALRDLPSSWTYTIVGNGPCKEELLRTIAEFGLADRVKILTDIATERLPEIYSQHDVFVMPTTWTPGEDREGFGIVYAEAALFGLPVLATRVPGVDEIVLHERTGLLVDDTHAALCEGLHYLSLYPEISSRYGKEGRVHALRIATPENFAKTYREAVEYFTTQKGG